MRPLCFLAIGFGMPWPNSFKIALSKSNLAPNVSGISRRALDAQPRPSTTWTNTTPNSSQCTKNIMRKCTRNTPEKLRHNLQCKDCPQPLPMKSTVVDHIEHLQNLGVVLLTRFAGDVPMAQINWPTRMVASRNCCTEWTNPTEIKCALQKKLFRGNRSATVPLRMPCILAAFRIPSRYTRTVFLFCHAVSFLSFAHLVHPWEKVTNREPMCLPHVLRRKSTTPGDSEPPGASCRSFAPIS